MNGYSFTPAEIERLVRLVMADLGLTGGAAVVPTAEPPAPAEGGDAVELRLSSRVITLEQIRSAPPKIRRLVVPNRAVVTPSARDELKKTGMQLAFDSAASVEASASAVPAFGRATLSASNAAPALAPRRAPAADPIRSLSVAYHAVLPEAVPARFLEELAKTVSIERYQNKCVMQTAEFLAGRLAQEKSKAVLFTRYTAAASAVCNRKKVIRAMIGAGADRLDADAASIGANLLIVDPGQGVFQIRRAVTRFVELGAAVCPDVLRKGLV